MKDFWSRRKALVEAETRAGTAAAENTVIMADEARLAERSDEELLEDLGLPAPEAIDDAETLRTYLRATLPRRLKQRALRRLWVLKPVLANLDGLVEYGEDYTDSAKVVGNLQTSYQVGRGMLAHIEKLSALSHRSEEPVQDEVAQVSDGGNVPELEDASQPETEAEPEAVPDIPESETAIVVSSRRMRFRFEPDDQGMADR